MSSDVLPQGMSDDQLSEVVKTLDQINSFPAKTERNYYVLKELDESKESRITLKDLREQLPLDDLRRKKPDYQSKENIYVEVEGEYFPDFLEENGIFLVSEPFLGYLRNTLHLREQHILNYIGLCAEQNERIETYCLIVPPLLDCILPGSARFDKNNRIAYFEIDESRVGKAEIFRVKGFPHLIVTQPLNRIDFAGYECTRMENFFDYAGVRDRDYRERENGVCLAEAFREYERRAMASDNYNFKYGLQRVADLKLFRREIAAGLQSIFTSYQGPGFSTENPAARNLTFSISMADGVVALREPVNFTQSEFTLAVLPQAYQYLETLPEVLKAAGIRVIRETLLAALIAEGRILEKYPQIHDGQRFRIYCEIDDLTTVNPPLVCDSKSREQRLVEAMTEFAKFDWNGKDLREYDFSGKNLSGLKIAGANLRQAKFNGCILINTEFSNCDLTGAEFKQAKMQGVKFTKCELNRTNFNYAEMPKAELKGSDLFQCSFIKTDLREVSIQNIKLSKAYFFKAKLQKARFNIRMTLFDIVFRLCDLRSVQFKGDNHKTVNIMAGCNFHNSDLSESKFALNRVSKTDFTKTKLIGAVLTQCKSFSKCTFKGIRCAGLNLDGLTLSECNFTKTDLTMLTPRSGVIFAENNNFTGANLSGYDFSVTGYLWANNFTNANLSNCNLEDADLSTSKLLNTHFNGANMNQAILETGQLEWVRLSAKQHNEIRLIEDDDEEDEDTNENDEIDTENDEGEFDEDGVDGD